MRRPLLVLLPLLGMAVAACQPQTVNPDWQYRPVADLPPLTLSYAPGRIDPSPAQRSSVRALASLLPPTVVPVFYGAGPQDEGRAVAIERLLDRPVRLGRLPDLAPDTAILVAPMPRGAILSDSCRGPGQRAPGGIWPDGDTSAPVLLPTGCAVETDLQSQVTQPGDLLAGRPLPPGASLPYAAAIERYYEGFGGAQAGQKDTGEGGGGGGGGGGTASNEPAGPPPANPLLGPLTGQAAGPR